MHGQREALVEHRRGPHHHARADQVEQRPGRHRRRPGRSRAQSASARSGCSRPGRRSAACRAGRRASAGSPRPRTAPRSRTRAGTRARPPRCRGGPRFLSCKHLSISEGPGSAPRPHVKTEGEAAVPMGIVALDGDPRRQRVCADCGPRPAKPNGLSGPILGCHLLAAAYRSRRPSHSQWERCRFTTKALSLQREADTAFGRVSVAALSRPFIRWSRPRLFISWSRRAANGFQRPPCRNFKSTALDDRANPTPG